jgi:ribosomal protein S18 acetylase RimI-like enzyme
MENIEVIPWDFSNGVISRAAERILIREVGDYFLASRDTARIAWGFVALDADAVVGAALGTTLNDDDRAHVMRTLDGIRNHSEKVIEFIAMLGKADRVGNLLALAVAPDFRRRGIGSQLVASRLAAFRKEGFDYALAEAWDMQGELSSSPLLEKLDFVRLAHVSRYWMTRAGAFGSPERCPSCGSLCYCSATVYGSLIS